jgi:hypothetical protein
MRARKAKRATYCCCASEIGRSTRVMLL